MAWLFKNIHKLVLPALLCVGQYSCDNFEDPALFNPPQLLPNPSFEANGQPSLFGWAPDDNSKVSFSSDVSTTIDNKFSLSVSGKTGVTSTKVHVRTDQKDIRISAWMKIIRTTGEPDSAELAVLGVVDGVTIFIGWLYVSDPGWHHYELIRRLSAVPSTGIDIFVQLRTPFLRPEEHALYDFCKIEVLDLEGNYRSQPARDIAPY